MTIPVENAPTYEVGQKPPPPDREEAAAIAERAAAEARLHVETPDRTRVVRVPGGCLASALLLTTLSVCFGASIAWGVIGGSLDSARAQLMTKIVGDLRDTAALHGESETHRGALAQLEELAQGGRIEWLAFSVLVNRWTDAKADYVITDAELTRLMSLVHDIDARGGGVDVRDYPDGR